MIGPLLLLAAAHSAQPVPVERPATAFVPTAGATTRATASVRILVAAKFGPGQSEKVAGALRRKAQIADQKGQPQSAILLEFQ
jgi:hypothetical protein